MRRDELKDQVRHGSYSEIAQAACENRRVLSWLMGLTYTPEEELGWKAVWSMGQAAAAVAKDDPEYVRGILRRLQWSLNDESGGIGWRAAAAMGAILTASPGTFDEFGPLIASFLDMEEEDFYSGVLWSIGWLAPQVGERLRFALPLIRKQVQSDDLQTRGMAVWALVRLGETQGLDSWVDDQGQFEFFDGNQLRQFKVADIIQMGGISI